MTQVIPAVRRSWFVAALALSLMCTFTPPVRGQDARPGDAHLEVLEKAIVDAKVPPEPQSGADAVPRPASLVPGKPQWVYRQAESRAIHATVYSVSLGDHYADAKAANGRGMLALDVELENIIPLTVIYEKKVPTEYQVPNLADHVYLVIDGVAVARLHPKAPEMAGHVKVKEFKLPAIGEKARGNLVFDAPLAQAKTLELRYYDYAHGHMALKLVGTDEAFAANEGLKPVQPPAKNEVVEAGVFGVKKVAELGGKPAPAGMTYVVADLRARSMFTFDGDATAFDPKARPGTKMKIGTVADWIEAHKYCQLVADGEYGYTPVPELTTLPPEPRFLPDLMTGGQVVFVAPADAKSLEIRCDFPNAKTPGGQVIRPKGLTLAVEGTRPQPPKRDALASVDDDVFKVAVVAQAAAAEFAGAKAADGKKFVVLDVTVNNAGKDLELFQTNEQLKYVTAAGAPLDVDAATWQGLHRPSPLVGIPPGERRTFQVAYQVPADETTPRLGYAGVSKQEVLALKPLEVGAAAAPVAEKPIAEKPGAEKPDAPAPAMTGPRRPSPRRRRSRRRRRSPTPRGSRRPSPRPRRRPRRSPTPRRRTRSPPASRPSSRSSPRGWPASGSRPSR
jgi:hypothetical protein